MASLLNPVGPEPPRVYWLRRAVVLAGLLVAIVIIVLMVKAASGADPSKPSASSSTASSSPTTTGTPDQAVTATAPPPPAAAVCAADALSVVISPAKESRRFAAGEVPTFKIVATNTGAAPCGVPTAPESLTLVITSGADRVYSSADCRAGDPAATDVKPVEAGAAIEFSVTWDPVARSAESCPTNLTAPARSAEATYIATVTLSQGTKSDEAPFVLN